MFFFVIARDALGLIRWGIPPPDREDGENGHKSAECQMTPDHSGH